MKIKSKAVCLSPAASMWLQLIDSSAHFFLEARLAAIILG